MVTMTLGISAAALATGATIGWVSTPGDASTRSGTRYGLKSTTPASSREVALEKIEGQRDSGRHMLLVGGVSFGAGMLLPGAWRLGPTTIGAALVGAGLGSIVALRNGEENVAHLPSEQEALASRLAPPAMPLKMPQARSGGWTPPSSDSADRIVTVAEQLGIR